MKKEDALSEVEMWKARLKIRRVASAFGVDWNVKFPCWCIEVKEEDQKILTRVKQAEASTGAPGYFKSALHAAMAMRLLPVEVWRTASGFSQDQLDL